MYWLEIIGSKRFKHEIKTVFVSMVTVLLLYASDAAFNGNFEVLYEYAYNLVNIFIRTSMVLFFYGTYLFIEFLYGDWDDDEDSD